MSTYNGVGFNEDLSFDDLTSEGHIRTEQPLTTVSPGLQTDVTRETGYGPVTDNTYFLEVFLNITRSIYATAGYSGVNAFTDSDYSDDVTLFFEQYAPASINTSFADVADAFVDFVVITRIPHGPVPNPAPNYDDLTPAYLDSVKARLAGALDLITRMNLGLMTVADNIQLGSYLFTGDYAPGGFSIFNALASAESIENVRDVAGIVTLGNYDLDSAAFPANLISDMSAKAFNRFIVFVREPNSNAKDTLLAAQDFFLRFAYVKDYMLITQTFTASMSSAQQEQFFRSFIVNEFSSAESTQMLSAEIGKYLDKAAQQYLIALNGSPSFTPESSVHGSFSKVVVLQRIYALIVEMIGVLQKMTASQSDQLKLMTEQQTQLSNIINEVHIFTTADGSEIDSTDSTSNEQTYRDSVNQVGTAWTDTIRANRDFVQNAAKSYQTNVSNSNDAVNQQASMATAFIQELSTLLGAIYR
jgi:hypothetical protein